MKKPYEAHEIEYQRMKRERICSWEERYGNDSSAKRREIDEDDKRFMIDVLSQPWAPKTGKAIELGCGSGPILRWLAKKGFTGLGIDVSRTAIRMARAQSQGYNVRFKQADFCRLNPQDLGLYDLCIDGHCLHCIINPEDRKAFLKNAYDLLKPRGLFILMTMCGPVDRRSFSRLFKHQKIVDDIIYAPYERANEYEGSRDFGGKRYMQTRYVPYWRNIITELRRSGFQPQLIRFNRHTPQDPCSSLAVGALTKRST